MVSSHYDEKVDAVIVGAGAAGSVLAAVLAEAGKSVRVMETGSARSLEDLYSSQLWGRLLHWSTPHVEDVHNSLYIPTNAGSGIGGTAMHQTALWPRFQPRDFKRQSLDGKGLDWPIEYGDLRPFYDAVQRDVGLSGDAQAESWRPPGDPYPLPPLTVFKHGEQLASGFQALGMQVSPAPVAILSQPYNGRRACTHDGWCLAGCPIGALGNPLVTYIPRARRAGAMFSPDRHVTRVLTDTRGQRATGVEYADNTGVRRVQPATVVLLAAFTVENVRLLLNSASVAHTNGLANASGLVGKYLMAHSTTNIYGLHDQDLQSYLGISTGSLYSEDRLPKFRNHPQGGGRHWHVALALKPNDVFGVMMTRPDLFGQQLADFIKRAGRSLTTMIGACENLPSLSNRIELSEQQDRFGMPSARVHYQPSEDGNKLTREVREEGMAITEAAGAKNVWFGPTVSQHVLGGTIMGVDPSASVTNSFGQTHEVPNLFVAGGSQFPTISHANPTFTLQSLALRSAEHLLAQWPPAS